MRNRLAGIAAVLVGFLGILLATPGCGENSRACGEGTKEVDGYCVGLDMCGFGTTFSAQAGVCVPDGTVVCSDGTVFDQLTGECKIDEAACQAGTILVGDACVDPTRELVIDVQEGPEPNGLGIIEESQAQAGNVILKATSPFVIHGTINPFRDLDGDGALDPDVDTFVITIGAPVFVKITADGVGGTAAGFVAQAVDAAAPLDTWKRVGMSLVSDTSVREVLLPRAGTYRLAIADTRTLTDYVTTGTSKTAPGSATSEYYVSLTPFTPAAPTPLTFTNGTATVNGLKLTGQLALYSGQMGNGLNIVDLTMPSALVAEALVIQNNGDLAAATGGTGAPLRAFVGGLAPADEPVVIIDEVYALLPTAEEFTMTVRASTATPLSTSGTTVTATARANNGSDFALLNLFSVEATLANATLGMDVTFSPAIVGQLYDANAQRVATFTNPSTTTTWTTYRGLVRVPKPGRYYFAVYAPSATSSTVLSATSRLGELVPGEVTEGTPLTNVAVNAFRAVPFTYAAGTTDAWQQFNVTGVNTGGQVASWFDPAITYGRLDSLTTSGGTLASEVTPIFTKTFAAAGGAFGRVLLSDPTLDYFVKVNATAPTATPTVTLDFAVRASMVDLGAIASGASASRTGDTLTTAAPQRYYLFRAPIGKSVTITVTPSATLNTTVRRLNADETTLGATANNGATGAADTLTFTQMGTDWTAIAVAATTSLAAGPAFNLTVQVQ